MHICRGKVKSISIVGYSEQKNCCKSTNMSNNCCQNLKFSFKQNHSQEEANSTIFIKSFVFDALPNFIKLELKRKILNNSIKFKNSFYKPPPPEVFPKIYISNCVYLI